MYGAMLKPFRCSRRHCYDVPGHSGQQACLLDSPLPFAATLACAQKNAGQPRSCRAPLPSVDKQWHFSQAWPCTGSVCISVTYHAHTEALGCWHTASIWPRSASIITSLRVAECGGEPDLQRWVFGTPMTVQLFLLASPMPFTYCLTVFFCTCLVI